jgi:hypothetical protein
MAKTANEFATRTLDTPLLEVLDAARRFLEFRRQATDIATGRAPAPRHLGEAIDRDFLLFDLERAAEALNRAVADADAERGIVRREGRVALS